MSKTIKSITPVQKRQVKGGEYKLVVAGGQGGWDVRIRYTDGTEKLLNGDFPYNLAQAGAAAQNYSEKKMQITYKTNRHGTITLANGETVELQQEAFLAGTHENPVYRASAYLGSENPDDKTGPTVTVTWEVVNLDADDESDCCDWESPSSINHYARGELL